MQGEARLRGLWRIIYSKTISPRLTRAKPACAGYTGLFVQRPSFRSPREARGARFQQRVDRNSFRSPREARDGDCGRPRRVQPCPTGSTEGVALRLGARASCPRRRDARETPARRPGSREPGRPQGLPLSSVEFLQFQPSVGDPMRLPLSSVEFLGEMSDVLHSYAPLPLIPQPPSPTRGEGGVWAS